MTLRAAAMIGSAMTLALGCSVLTNLDGFVPRTASDAGIDAPAGDAQEDVSDAPVQKPVSCVLDPLAPRRVVATVPGDQVQNKLFLMKTTSQYRAVFEVFAGGSSKVLAFGFTPTGMSVAATPLAVHLLDLVRYAGGIVALAQEPTSALSIYTLKDSDTNWAGPVVVSNTMDFAGANRLIAALIPISVATGEFVVVGSYNAGNGGPLSMKAAHVKGNVPSYTSWPLTAMSDPLGQMPVGEDLSATTSAFDGNKLVILMYANHSSGAPVPQVSPNVYTVDLSTDPNLQKPNVVQLPIKSKSDFMVALALSTSQEVAGSFNVGAIALEGGTTPELYAGRVTTANLESGSASLQSTLTQTPIMVGEIPAGRSHYDQFPGPNNENLMLSGPKASGGVHFVWLDGAGQLHAKLAGSTALLPGDTVLMSDVAFDGPAVAGAAHLTFGMVEPSSMNKAFDLVAAGVTCGF